MTVLFIIILITGVLILADSLRKASNKIDSLLHFEVELENGSICHECGQAYPCLTLVGS